MDIGNSKNYLVMVVSHHICMDSSTVSACGVCVACLAFAHPEDEIIQTNEDEIIQTFTIMLDKRVRHAIMKFSIYMCSEDFFNNFVGTFHLAISRGLVCGPYICAGAHCAETLTRRLK